MANRRLTTLLIHGKHSVRELHGETVPPVSFSAAFEHASAEDLEAVFAGKQEGFLYSRLQNPTVQLLEQRITEVCQGQGALAVATGMSAITLGLLGLAQAGDEIIAGNQLFGGTFTLLNRTLPALGITTHFVPPHSPEGLDGLVKPNTRAVLLEAIANPAMTVPDFAQWRAFCQRHNLPLLIDATLITPCRFDNSKLGAALAFFSSTKYIAGAASTMGGLVVDTGAYDWLANKSLPLADFRKFGPQAFLAKLRRQMMADIGPVLSPMAAFLQMTGLESLDLRFERQCQNAQEVARFLAQHPKVRQVLHPSLPAHPSHALAQAQYGCFGGLMAFLLEDKAQCFRFLNALGLILRATNLGDSKTLALHPASTIYAGYWPHELEQVGVSESMIRLSVGLEDVRDLLEDLGQALEKV